MYFFILLNCKTTETFEKCKFLFEFKEDENFNHRHALSIPRIELKLHFVQNVESDAEIGQKGAFCKGLEFYSSTIPIRVFLNLTLSVSSPACSALSPTQRAKKSYGVSPATI